MSDIWLREVRNKLKMYRIDLEQLAPSLIKTCQATQSLSWATDRKLARKPSQIQQSDYKVKALTPLTVGEAPFLPSGGMAGLCPLTDSYLITLNLEVKSMNSIWEQ